MPLLHTTTHKYTHRKWYSFIAVKEVLKLCFHKHHWVALILGILAFIGIGIAFPLNNIFYLRVAEVFLIVSFKLRLLSSI